MYVSKRLGGAAHEEQLWEAYNASSSSTRADPPFFSFSGHTPIHIPHVLFQCAQALVLHVAMQSSLPSLTNPMYVSLTAGAGRVRV